jgi:hypothetical protein
MKVTTKNYKCVLCGSVVRPRVLPSIIVKAKVCANCYFKYTNSK